MAWRLAAIALLGPKSLVAEALDESCAGATNLVQLGSTLQRRDLASYWYPSRGVDDNRSGWSSAEGPFPLKPPKWQFEVAHINFHQTPCIDDQLNVYTGSDQGMIFSFTKAGWKRWEVATGASNCQNPTILEGVLYTSCANGVVLALTMDEGKEVWSRKLTDSLPTDTYTVSATASYVVVPYGDMGHMTGGANGLALLERASGDVRWTYNISAHSPGAHTINMAPCLFEDSIVTSDTSGGIYRLSVEDGSELWRSPPENAGTFTLGGVACGEGLVFNGFSKEDGSGGLQALNLSSGERLWAKSFPQEIHNAPAVGRVYGHPGRTAAIVGQGGPPGAPLPIPDLLKGTVVAVDVTDGETLWTFEPPPWHHHGAAGSTFLQPCMPDLFSGATIDGRGTVYINWSAGGITYALRDANGDGRIDERDPAEVSAFDLGSGATGPPAIAPGMLFVNACRRPSAFLA
ncbi:afsK [Symbiodinium natans]|uniref:AfsK protein n=1 Tax=Symbiodinium natans TaxID=878477 RepID=A0A812ILA4_9DINO|nr:afsK [Symbiodinium natans]